MKTYDGAATLTIAGTSHPVRVRLIGHLDPIDGNYHWQGTILSSTTLPGGLAQADAGGDADGGRAQCTRAHRRADTVGHAFGRRSRRPAVRAAVAMNEVAGKCILQWPVSRPGLELAVKLRLSPTLEVDRARRSG